MKLESKVVIHGVTASLLLMLAYFAVVSYVESFNHAVDTFLSIAYLMVPLMAGFGAQVALFSYSRQYSHKAHQSLGSTTACGGISVGSMIACCAHHVTDFIPILGIAAVASLIASFQPLLIMIGLLSNLAGILTILSIIQRHSLYDSNGTFAPIMRVNFNKARNYGMLVSSIIVVGLAWNLFTSQASTTDSGATFNLPAKTLEQEGLTVKVAPSPLNTDQKVEFKISFDTHMGSLNFDVARLASLEDNSGNRYEPASWSGDPPGGHHREGTLSFPPLEGGPQSIKLIMKNIYGVDWIFEWVLAE